jgi:NAD(P)-dependent dehydrogenase (short-subunit alcohol dehydrogenase family)
MKKVMVVTGASRGIGAAVARLAAREGYAVCVNYVQDGKAAQTVVNAIESNGGRAIAVQADVGQAGGARRLFDEVDRELGVLDVLVNNAGVLNKRRVDDMDEDTLQWIFGANVFSLFHCARLALRRMSTRHGGRGGVIVNISSVAARLGGLPENCHYAATKGATDSFTVALAKEVGAEGVRVNAVRPGLIETDIHGPHGGLDPLRALARGVPLARPGSPDEIAETVLWLASPRASYVHGALIDVSGGR